MDDFDGCRKACRQAGTHTQIPGECETAPGPQPRVSLLHTGADGTGSPRISFDTYTLEGLADLIEPALKNVDITFGPNSLDTLKHGNSVCLTGYELRSLALEAAYAIIHRNENTP